MVGFLLTFQTNSGKKIFSIGKALFAIYVFKTSNM